VNLFVSQFHIDDIGILLGKLMTRNRIISLFSLEQKKSSRVLSLIKTWITTDYARILNSFTRTPSRTVPAFDTGGATDTIPTPQENLKISNKKSTSEA